MTRVAATLGAAILWAAAAFWAAAASAQQPTKSVSEDPHYRRVLYAAHLRIFEVTIPTGETTLDHSHEYDSATLTVADAAVRTRGVGEEWSLRLDRPRGNVTISEYTGSPAAHRVESVNGTTYRAIAIENLRERGWTKPKSLSAAGTSLRQESRAFAVYDVRLGADAEKTNHFHEVPTVAVLIEGAIQNQGEGGSEPFRVQGPGRWIYVPMAQMHTMTVSGTNPAHVIEIEVR
jgi:quercetin dioxygenase-like cupin family protein